MSRIVLGVCGSVAAYKAADLARRLTVAGHAVDVVMTRAATEFVRPLTFRSLTGREAHSDLFADQHDDIRHITLAQRADLVVVAPATAATIARLANGAADDYLSTLCLALRQQPRLLAPAMNTAMYDHPAVQANLARLIDFGWRVIEPADGLLACGQVGRGALAPVDTIVAAVTAALAAAD
ncbi:MAG: phosphopantothenoylcysteine decarboxylase [Propionibacteriaceae bacterium]|jgi:phosphopantothenoylcysteine decarboxylase/phosphopantothenoylcysteine decarboxylase/phosphopantothenate--cysteine ligase|nr:phosphopantothenoylcysteine decarboxylase [Propionibacteriaceae bacterium]